MSDESPLPSARRVLLQGVAPSYALGKITSYEELDKPGPDSFTVTVRQGDGGWVQLDIDPTMPLYHFHNLGMWMAGLPNEDPLPSQIVLQSRGPLAVDYWLVPRDNGSVLHGRRADNSPYAFDLATGKVVVESAFQANSMTERVALLNRGVPIGLIDDWEGMAVFDRAQVRPFSMEDRELTFVGRMLKSVFGRS